MPKRKNIIAAHPEWFVLDYKRLPSGGFLVERHPVIAWAIHDLAEVEDYDESGWSAEPITVCAIDGEVSRILGPAIQRPDGLVSYQGAWTTEKEWLEDVKDRFKPGKAV